MKCYTYNGVTLTEELLFEAIRKLLSSNSDLSKLAAILYKLDNPKNVLENLSKEGETVLKLQATAAEKDYIPVTSFATANHTFLKRRLAAEYIESNRKLKWVEEHLSEFGGDQDKAEASFEEQIFLEKYNTEVGSHVHDLVNIILTKGRGSEYTEFIENLKEYYTEHPDAANELTKESTIKDKSNSLKTQAIVTNITNAAEKLAKWVKDTYGNDYEIYSELPLVLKKTESMYLNCSVKGEPAKEYKGIIGKADLILLNKETGKVVIVDYKVCSRPYREWYLAKTNEVDFLLALYRAMLTEKGFNGRDIELKIKPILFEKLNILSLAANHAIQDTVDALDARGSKASNVSWDAGHFTEELRKLGIGNLYSAVIDTDLKKAIDEDRKYIIEYEDPKILTKNYFLREDKVEKYEDGWRFWSVISEDWVTAPTKDEITKDGGLLDLYIEKLVASRNEVAKTILKEIKEFRDALANDKKLDKESFLGAKGLRKEMLQAVLGPYLNSDWQLLSETLPSELLDRGILIFGKPTENGSMIIDIVTLAEGPLSMNIPINGNNHYVFGKYIEDNKGRTIPRAMTSEYRNVKAIETAGILNTLLSRHPDLFNGARFGQMIVLNPNGQYVNQQGLDWNLIMDNFDIICAKENANIKNHLRRIKMPKTYEYCASEMSRIITKLKEDSKLRKMLKAIEDAPYDRTARIKMCLRLMDLLREEYPNECGHLGIKGSDKISLNSDPQQVYILLALMYNDLIGLRPDFTGRIPKTGFTPLELFSLLGILPFGTQAITDNTGDKIVGLGNGMLMSSPRTTPSETLKQLFAYYDAKYLEIREAFTTLTNYISKLTGKYIKDCGGGQVLNSSNLKIWERLLVHDSDGKVDKRMLIKNPYDQSNDLTDRDREFLKEYLWELNKWFCEDPNLKRNWKYKDHVDEITNSEWFIESTLMQDNKYFRLPLAKASRFLRSTSVTKLGLKTWWDGFWKEFEESYDPRYYHDIRKKQLKNDLKILMDNTYDINDQMRKEYIDNVANPYDFSFDLDYLALDVAFHTLRKEHFDEAVMATESLLVVMNFMQLNSPDMDFTDEIEVARDLLKVIKGESVLSKEEEKIAKPLGAVKMLNNVINLGFRPLSFLKELTFGMFTNYSRAWALKYGSNALHFDTITKALGIVFGERIDKKGKVLFGNERLTNFYLCEQINRLYAIANQDLTRTVDNSSIAGNGGFINNMSRYMYLAQSAPDYYNRLTLFIAKMIEDGCFEAHSLDGDGNLHYDWKKDKRFSELAKHGLNSDYSSSEYNKQKALYVRMCLDFAKSGESLIYQDPNTKKVMYKDLTKCYTADQKASIKEVSDVAFGFYDHESKSLINRKFLGLVFLQFQTFLSAKYNLWLKGTSRRGDNTAQGKFVEMVRNGEKYYIRHQIGPNGEYLGTENVPESQLTEEEKKTLIPAMEWEGDFVEGLMYSILYTVRDICTFNWKEVRNNPQRWMNCLLAMHDIFLGIILYNILKFIFSGGSGKTQDVEPLLRVFLRGMQDVGPGAFTQLSFTPSFINTLETLKNDGLKLLTDSETGLSNLLKHIGGTRDWIYDED